MSVTVKHQVSLFVAIGLITFASLPSAHASKLYIETPSFSFGIKDYGNHYNRRDHRHDNYQAHRKHRKHDRHHRRHHKPRYGYNDYYYSPRHYYPRNSYPRNSYPRRYYSYRKPYRDSYRSSSRTYRSSICPTAGYSPYYYEDSGCYRHKDHFHCN